MVLKAGDTATITTVDGSRQHVPQPENGFSRHFSIYEYSQEATAESVAELGVGALRKAAVEGDTRNGCFLAGQISGMVSKEQPAAEMIAEMFAQAEDILKGAAKWIR